MSNIIQNITDITNIISCSQAYYDQQSLLPEALDIFIAEEDQTEFVLSTIPTGNFAIFINKVEYTNFRYDRTINSIILTEAPAEGSYVEIRYLQDTILPDPYYETTLYITTDTNNFYYGSRKLSDTFVVDSYPDSLEYPNDKIYLVPRKDDNDNTYGYKVYFKHDEIVTLIDSTGQYIDVDEVNSSEPIEVTKTDRYYSGESQTDFVLSHEPVDFNDIIVTVDDISVSFTYDNTDNKVILNEAPQEGSIVKISYQYSTNTVWQLKFYLEGSTTPEIRNIVLVDSKGNIPDYIYDQMYEPLSEFVEENYTTPRWNVSGAPGPGPVPTGTITITENGTYDVTNYASAIVNSELENEASLALAEIIGEVNENE